MSGKQEIGQGTVTDDSVTDDALETALAEAMREEQVQEQPVEEPQQPEGQEPQPPPRAASTPQQPEIEEPDDPAARSRLGRKVRWLEQQLEQLRTTQVVPQARPTESSAPPQEEVPEFITTPDELERYLSIRENRRNRETQGYQMGYANKFMELGREDDNYDEIEKEMMANFNVRRTGDPAVDAEINYAKAQASVLRKKIASPAPPSKPVIPGRRDNPQGAGVTVASRNQRPANSPPPLDDVAAEFVRSVGMKDESIREALGGLRKR